MFYIKHGSDNFTIIDCCMEEAYREEIVSEQICAAFVEDGGNQ